jgi:flagellar hook assembly protein FlgD
MSTKAFFTALALSVSSTLAFANTDESSVTVVAGENEHVFKVVYKSAAATRVEVSIRNSKNEIVFSESFNRMNRFTRPYNFRGLPEGEYTIEVKDSKGKKVEKVNYSLGVVRSLVKVTKINTEPAKYMVSVGNKGTNVIDVSIYNEQGDLLIYNSHVVEGDFGIVYNLVTAGSYTFVVSDKTGKSNTIEF